ncbi:MAG: phosphohydrolase [Verrucomicrobia bacterium]|nr:MAG: phosphohydrolase [Verrucomicrobiota bacterium]
MTRNLATVAGLKSPQLSEGTPFETVVVVRKVTSRKARNDNTFLSIEFGDRTGTFTANCFSDHSLFALFRENAEGTAVLLTGKIEHYQGRFSPRLAAATVLSEDELEEKGWAGQLVEVPPESSDTLAGDLDQLITAIKHPGLLATVQGVMEELGDRFLQLPAAVSMHHAYRTGLLEHTVHMGKACLVLLPLYPEVDPDLALAGVLLHDAGKALEYEGSLAYRKTRIGLLHGHVVLGYRLVRKAALKAGLDSDLLERLEHIILSHQGELEWGAAVMAATPEAVFVSMVDNLDARMGMVQRAMRHSSESDEFSEYLPGLKSPLLIPPPRIQVQGGESDQPGLPGLEGTV